MNTEIKKAYIYQPLPISEFGANDGRICKVVFKDGTMTPLLTRQDAEYVLSQTAKREVKVAIRKTFI